MLTISRGEATLRRCQMLTWLQLVFLTSSLHLWAPSPTKRLHVGGGNNNAHLRQPCQGTPSWSPVSPSTVFFAPPASSRAANAQGSKFTVGQGAQASGTESRFQTACCRGDLKECGRNQRVKTNDNKGDTEPSPGHRLPLSQMSWG